MFLGLEPSAGPAVSVETKLFSSATRRLPGPSSAGSPAGHWSTYVIVVTGTIDSKLDPTGARGDSRRQRDCLL